MSRPGVPRLTGTARKHFWQGMAAVTTWLGLGLWLRQAIGWPDAYGLHCRRSCLLLEYWHSPALLSEPSGYTVSLFAWLWLLPAALVATLLLERVGKWRARSHH
jgi:hypothetical protein